MRGSKNHAAIALTIRAIRAMPSGQYYIRAIASACIGNFLEAAFARQPVEAMVYKTLKDTTWTPLLHTPWKILGGERGCLEDSRG